MKPILVLPVALGLALMSCQLSSLPGLNPTSTPQAGSGLLADPAAGLDQLEHYRNTLTITFQGQKDNQAIEVTSRIDNAVWRQPEAGFSTIDDQDEVGQPRHLLVGHVGQAQYAQLPDSEGCDVTWGAAAPGTGMLDPSNLLPAIRSGNDLGETNLDGITASHFHLDAGSMGLTEGQATGDVWIATKGGFVVKYHLEIKGGAAVLGQGLDGTRTYDYAISEVNDGSPVSYPKGCEPVLAEVPALADALDEERLPGVLSFTTGSTQEQVGTFYNHFFAQNGWTVISQPAQADSYPLWVYRRADSDDLATIAMDPDQGFAWVTVTLEGGLNANAPSAATAEASEPTVSPGSQAQNPVARFNDALQLLLGSGDYRNAFPSFSIRVDSQIAEGLPAVSESFEAEVQGKDIHLNGTLADSPTEVYLVGGKEYMVSDGALQEAPGVAMMAWNNWQTSTLAAIHAAAASQPTQSGSETIAGRQADVFVVEGSPAAAAQGQATSAFSVTHVNGKVWIDQASGALLKADLNYTAAMTLAGLATQPNGECKLEISVSQIGQAQVTLPAH